MKLTHYCKVQTVCNGIRGSGANLTLTERHISREPGCRRAHLFFTVNSDEIWASPELMKPKASQHLLPSASSKVRVSPLVKNTEPTG